MLQNWSRNGDLMSTINDLNRRNADLKNRNGDLERQLEQTRDDRKKQDFRDKRALYENQECGACTSAYACVCCEAGGRGGGEGGGEGG